MARNPLYTPAVTRDLHELEQALRAQGIAVDASVSSTLGHTQGSIAVAPTRELRMSQLPEADLEPPPDAEFAIRGELGRGGMATVWLAEQTALARDVAVKRPTQRDDEASELLILREAVITGQLEHPNIVPVHALVVDEQGPAVVMKRVSGQSWESLIVTRQTSLERHVDILLQVLNAVAFAHSRGVIHRDIKPANVMIGEYGEVYLLDWGVARRMSDPPSDAIVGTPRYMAPEMAEGHADERTDIFLLGATLHEVLTGEPRHRGENALTVLYAAMYVEPYAYGSEVPEELAAIANRACARDPAERYASVSELRDVLATYREHRSTNAVNDAAEERLRALCHATASLENNGYGEVQRLFTETRFGFETALRVWPESPRALAGRAAALRVMIDYELGARHPDAAEALLDALGEPDPARSGELARVREAQRRERERVEAIERDRDPRVGAQARARAYTSMGAAVLLMTLALIVQRVFFRTSRPSTLRLMIVGAVVLTIMLVTAEWWRRRGSWNFINRRIAEISVGTLAVSFASRLSGVITHAEPEQVLIADAFILGLGGATMAAYHRAGPWLAGVSFSVAILGSIWPQYVDDMFIGLTVFVGSAMLLLRRAGLVVPDDYQARIANRDDAPRA